MFRFISIMVLAIALCSSAALADVDLNSIYGDSLVADDGTFLGTISCDSLGNPYSEYGSRFNSDSIWNKFGTYGSPYSGQSPYNRFTSTPPILTSNGSRDGYLTVSTTMSPALSPGALEGYLVGRCHLARSLR